MRWYFEPQNGTATERQSQDQEGRNTINKRRQRDFGVLLQGYWPDEIGACPGRHPWNICKPGKLRWKIRGSGVPSAKQATTSPAQLPKRQTASISLPYAGLTFKELGENGFLKDGTHRGQLRLDIFVGDNYNINVGKKEVWFFVWQEKDRSTVFR